MSIYQTYGLDQTIRVTSAGTVTHGIEVPHEGANLRCFQVLGKQRDPESGVTYPVLCRKRAGHPTPKDEIPHIPVDTRQVASVPHRAARQRFVPAGIPAGVDLSFEIPHDCRNHLD